MIELILEVVGEFLLQVVGEALLEFGLHALAKPFRRRPNPWVAALGYAMLGAALGSLSLLLFPANLVPRPWRILNLIATPVAVGAIMALLGTWRARRGQPVLRLDRFACGYVFALSLALVRFGWAE